MATAFTKFPNQENQFNLCLYKVKSPIITLNEYIAFLHFTCYVLGRIGNSLDWFDKSLIRNGSLLKPQHFEAINSSVDCNLVYLLSLCKTVMMSFNFLVQFSLEFKGKTPLSECETSGVSFF